MLEAYAPSPEEIAEEEKKLHERKTEFALPDDTIEDAEVIDEEPLNSDGNPGAAVELHGALEGQVIDDDEYKRLRAQHRDEQRMADTTVIPNDARGAEPPKHEEAIVYPTRNKKEKLNDDISEEMIYGMAFGALKSTIEKTRRKRTAEKAKQQNPEFSTAELNEASNIIYDALRHTNPDSDDGVYLNNIMRDSFVDRKKALEPTAKLIANIKTWRDDAADSGKKLTDSDIIDRQLHLAHEEAKLPPEQRTGQAEQFMLLWTLVGRKQENTTDFIDKLH